MGVRLPQRSRTCFVLEMQDADLAVVQSATPAAGFSLAAFRLPARDEGRPYGEAKPFRGAQVPLIR